MNSPFVKIKSTLKRHPVVYDWTLPLKRVFTRTPAYDYLNMLSRECGAEVSFIQIGANDGLRNDPIREFVVRDRWKGVFVEPLPSVFADLRRNYGGRRFSGLYFENAAVSQFDGETLEFWTFRKNFLDTIPVERQLYYLRKASFDRNHVSRFLTGDVEAQDALESIEVPCVTVDTLAQRYFDGGRFDLLVIDAEGHENVILESIDFGAVRPRVIFFESEHMDTDNSTLSLLREAGYCVRRLSDKDSVAERQAGEIERA